MFWRSGQEISSKTVFKLLMLICGVVLLLPFPRRLTELGDRGLWVLLGPISRGGRYLAQRTGEDSPASASEKALAERLRQAEVEIYNLQQQLRQARELTEQLSGLSGQFGRAPVRLIPAQVTGSDSASWRNILHLNRQRLKPGQIVLSKTRETTGKNGEAEDAEESIYQMCVVGQIKDDDSATFRLQLLTDVDFSLPVFIEPRRERQEQWRAEGHLRGGGMGEIEVIMAKAEYPVQVGDAVLACSDPKKLPVEMLVGFVKSCPRDPDNPVFWQITVAPAADLTALREVIIVGTQWEGQL